MVGQFLDILSDGNKTVAAGVHVEAAQGLSASLHQPRQFTLQISTLITMNGVIEIESIVPSIKDTRPVCR